MPLIKLSGNQWKFGKTGKEYPVRWKAVKQGRAISISKKRQAGENIPYPKSVKVKASSRARGYEKRIQ